MLPDTYFQGSLHDRREKVIVLKHLCRRLNILRPACFLLKKIDFFKDYPDLGFLFHVLYRYYTEFNNLPSSDVLLLEMDAMNQQSASPFPTEMLSGFKSVLAEWNSCSEWSDDYVKSIISDSAKLYAKDGLLINVADNDDMDEIRKQLQKAERSFSEDIFETLSIENAWHDIESAMIELKKERVGVSFIDNVLDGGLAEGEALLLIAPSGGGKTTIGMQCAAAQVAKGQHVVFLSTEQRLQGDMSIRQFVLGTGHPRSEFMKGYQNLSEDVLKKLKSVSADWIEYFHFVDCRKSVRAINSIEDLFTPIDNLIGQGKQPSLVILDWWGRLQSRLTMQQSRMSDTRLRHASADWMDTFLDGVRSRKARTMVLHQASGAASRKGPDALITTHDAQENTNLNNLFEFGFALSKLDSDNRCKINCDKARSAARTNGELQLIGDNCTFVLVGPTDVDPADIPQGRFHDDLINANDYIDDGMIF